jgi:hypothetical protein
MTDRYALADVVEAALEAVRVELSGDKDGGDRPLT